MAFESRAIDRSLPAPNLVGSVFRDDPEKLHSDLIDLDIGLRGGHHDEADDEDGFFKSLTESIASGKYSITTEKTVKEVKVLTLNNYHYLKLLHGVLLDFMVPDLLIDIGPSTGPTSSPDESRGP